MRSAAEALERERLLNKKEIARFVGVSEGTVTRWTTRHSGPRFYRVGGVCRFSLTDVLAWLETRAQGGVGMR
jgi:excisionase family DNA binding protein